ncbi:hypothetical protein K402DRAFT_390596 [Aulographum hederae CBS 113979]|uniref:Uncharacterized protein n=1 Tax=Aulographum hederae CBS 113979 TaxID=1176131 RepID=A0A6G1H994_9PEZI|nr:hypothetical protein K402DRAFT_390596 [Aulographum hederae CBS 113979]
MSCDALPTPPPRLQMRLRLRNMRLTASNSYGGPPQGYPQQPYGQQPMQYQQGPPQQVIVREKKDRGCLGSW